jgi:hypothetical protein
MFKANQSSVFHRRYRSRLLILILICDNLEISTFTSRARQLERLYTVFHAAMTRLIHETWTALSRVRTFRFFTESRAVSNFCNLISLEEQFPCFAASLGQRCGSRSKAWYTLPHYNITWLYIRKTFHDTFIIKSQIFWQCGVTVKLIKKLVKSSTFPSKSDFGIKIKPPLCRPVSHTDSVVSGNKQEAAMQVACVSCSCEQF